MTEPLSISAADVADQDGRFDRFKLIGWWDQKRLADAKVLVIGAGALGNEIIKNLALLGVGHVVIADKDTIENSNLSRSVLYRAEDTGKPKSAVAASAAMSLYPDIKVQGLNIDVVHDLGAGVFRWADVVIGGLDNREARLAINRQCWRVGRPWVDGAIEVIQGVARVFVPDAEQANACYECTMSDRDWKLLAHRRSCNLLTRAQMEGGRTPTTPTIGSIIAGVEVQETLKLLHNLPTLAGRGFVFSGETADSYIVDYQRKASCQSHDTLPRIVELETGAADTLASDLLATGRKAIGDDAVLDLGRDVAREIFCHHCQHHRDVFRSLGTLRVTDATCVNCGQAGCEVVTFTTIRGDEPYAGRSLADLGIPPFDLVSVRNTRDTVGYELTADAAAVLGACFDEGLEWT